MESSTSYDIVVIGGGPGGAAAARALAHAGKKVALVSTELGGECLNYGCIPTKTYLWTAEMFEKIRDGADMFGIVTQPTSVNWQRMKERRIEVVNKLKKQLAFSIQKSGVTVIQGMATFVSPTDVEVTTIEPGVTGDKVTFHASHFIIATGSVPAQIPGFEINDRIVNNHGILDLQEIPKTLLIIGGGVIGVEFASIFATLGTHVTIAESAPRLLPMEDPDVSAELERIFARKNITMLKNTRITPGETTQFEKILVAVGRTPAVASLGLEKIGVKMRSSSQNGIETNDSMQTNLPHIFAIGDVAGKAFLAYTAEHEGKIAAAAILGRPKRPLRYDTVASTIFSLPEVASVGLNEETAKSRGIEYSVGKSLSSGNAKALIIGNRDGFAKVIVEKGTRKLRGVHIIGEKASELIAEASLALTHDMTLEDFAENIHSHPILGEVVKEACEAVEQA